MQNVCKMYANSMQKICKNYAKSIQKLCKKDTVMHCTLIYMDYARHGEIQGHSLALGTWHLAPAYFWEVDHPPMRCLNGKKTQILVAHQKQTIDWSKKGRLAAKKSSTRLEDFVHVFGKLTTPYVMFESKKLNFLLLI